MAVIKSRSRCPISQTLDIVGDRWSLLIMREMIFGRRSSYKELGALPEHIATNILAERLDRLENAGIIHKQVDPLDGRKSIYGVTEKGRDLQPVLVAMIHWGMKHTANATYPSQLVD